MTDNTATEDSFQHQKTPAADYVALSFSNKVISLMNTDRIDVMSAVLEVAEVHKIDEEDIPNLLTPKLFSMIQKEADTHHLIKKEHRNKDESIYQLAT